MDKTLLKKFTENHYYHKPAVAYANGEDGFNGMAYEMGLLREAAKDLLQPRPQAISRLLQMAREI